MEDYNKTCCAVWKSNVCARKNKQEHSKSYFSEMKMLKWMCEVKQENLLGARIIGKARNKMAWTGAQKPLSNPVSRVKRLKSKEVEKEILWNLG